jgi:hypothetical protein
MMAHEAEDRISVEELETKLQQIYRRYSTELQQTPVFTPPENLPEEDREKWFKKVKFAEDFHRISLLLIFQYFFAE